MIDVLLCSYHKLNIGFFWCVYFCLAKKCYQNNIGAFTSFRDRVIILNDMKWISHEAGHVICWLEFQEKHAGIFNYNQCNQDIDTKDIMEQVANHGLYHKEPPKLNPIFQIEKDGIVL